MTVALVGFGLAAAGYAILAGLLALHLRSNLAQGWLLLASVVTVAWAGGLALFLRAGGLPGDWLWAVDATRNGAWVLFVSMLLPRQGSGQFRLGLIVAMAAIVGLLGLEAALGRAVLPFASTPLVLLLVTALLGLLAIEQIYRNADPAERRSVSLLALGLGGVFAFELFVYSHALLLMGLDQVLWASRGFVAALVAPVLVLFARRSRQLRSELYVSHKMVFYAATLLGAGVYLLAMSAVGHALRTQGGEWGVTLQVVFLVAAGMLLAGVLFSARLRSRVRVFLSKHFFQSRYDYRKEWLNLIATLADHDGGSALTRALTALRNILDSETGQLWLHDPAGTDYLCVESAGEPPRPPYAADHPVTRFLAETNWIVDTDEYSTAPRNTCTRSGGWRERSWHRAPCWCRCATTAKCSASRS